MKVQDWSQFPNFSKEEFDDREDGSNEMRFVFMDKIQMLRSILNRPVIVNSGYRSPQHSIEAAKKNGPGPHSTGLAADFKVGPGIEVYRFVQVALELEFTGIGVSQRQGQPRFVHLDLVSREAIWSY